jgi:NADH-quinone oxidoreductase subunit E
MVIRTNSGEEINFAVVDAIIHKRSTERGAVIPILQEIKGAFGYVPPEAIKRIAQTLCMPESEIFGVATFYSQFQLQPQGKHTIKVCHGTACHLAGADNITRTLEQTIGIKEGETSPDRQFTLEAVACLGCCSLAPCIMIDDTIHGRLTPESATRLIEQIRQEDSESEPVSLN